MRRQILYCMVLVMFHGVMATAVYRKGWNAGWQEGYRKAIFGG